MSCQGIDDIWKCFEQLESDGKLSVVVKNYIQELKFFLSYVRLHVKRGIFLSSSFHGKLQSWIQYVEVHLIQPIRKGNMAIDALEEIFSGLLLNIHWVKEDLYSNFSDYYQSERHDRGFAYQDVLIDELLMDWLDALLKNLKYLIHCGDCNLLVLPEERIKELHDKLMFFKNFLEIIGKDREGILDKSSYDIFTQVKFVLGSAIYLSYLSWMQRKIHNLDKFFFDLLVKINHIESRIRLSCKEFLKASKIENLGTLGIDIQVFFIVDSLLDNVWKLIKDQDTASIMPLDLHQLEFLHRELNFLKIFLQDPCWNKYADSDLENINTLLIQVGSMSRQGVSLTHSIYGGQSEDHMINEMKLWNSDFLAVLKSLKGKFRQMCLRVPKPSTSCFPQTPKSRFLDSFMQRLDELLKHDARSIAYMKKEIETLWSDFSFLSSSLREIIENPEKDENTSRLIMDLAYEAEHVIDLISASHYSRWCYMLWLSDISEKVKLLREESIVLCDKKTHNITKVNAQKASIRQHEQVTTWSDEDDVVGFSDEMEKIINQLAQGPKQLDIVSIVGMPGLGKTTLARKLYEDPQIRNYFHVQGWYCISQVFDKRHLLLSILCDVTGQKIRKMDVEDAEEKLYRSLRGKRYFIVIDDIWSIEPWNQIHISFPDDCNGSRILFTTRIREVALEANPRSAPNDLRMFSFEESWELLEKKVFMGKNCPETLQEIGERIAWSCNGLPLLVVAIAGTLKTSKSEDHWRKILQSLEKQRISSSTEYKDLLELSYNHLPDHLKTCFLYLGAFPEDREIPSWKLVRLWIAEGLVQKNESENLEVAAEGYLEDLVSRNLVLIFKNKYNRGIKSCYLHDLWRTFSVEKARDEKVFLLSQELVDPKHYRHSFFVPENLFYGWKPNYPNVRSLLSFPAEGSLNHHDELYPADLSVLPYVLKLLRVLDLESFNIGHQFPKIEFLVHLRYLAVRGSINHVPSSIGKLWRLETLIVEGTGSAVRLPGVLLEMTFLKHVSVNKMAVFELPDESFKSCGIEKLSKLLLLLGDGTIEKVMRKLKNLRRLNCIFLESLADSGGKNYSQVPLLDLLSRLESLNIVYCGKDKVLYPFEFTFPSNLKKLTLSTFRFPWSSISMIGRLPQLEVLKLLMDAFVGQIWEREDSEEDEFQKLKVLKLENLDIVEWYASPNAFPCLEQLVLHDCDQLKEIPSGFAELDTLRMLHLQGCNGSAVQAAWKILEDQKELGIDELQVFIH